MSTRFRGAVVEEIPSVSKYTCYVWFSLETGALLLPWLDSFVAVYMLCTVFLLNSKLVLWFSCWEVGTSPAFQQCVLTDRTASRECGIFPAPVFHICFELTAVTMLCLVFAVIRSRCCRQTSQWICDSMWFAQRFCPLLKWHECIIVDWLDFWSVLSYSGCHYYILQYWSVKTW
jgi:hypothetical protein